MLNIHGAVEHRRRRRPWLSPKSTSASSPSPSFAAPSRTPRLGDGLHVRQRGGGPVSFQLRASECRDVDDPEDCDRGGTAPVSHARCEDASPAHTAIRSQIAFLMLDPLSAAGFERHHPGVSSGSVIGVDKLGVMKTNHVVRPTAKDGGQSGSRSRRSGPHGPTKPNRPAASSKIERPIGAGPPAPAGGSNRSDHRGAALADPAPHRYAADRDPRHHRLPSGPGSQPPGQ